LSITQDRWNEEQCRIENGIFFATDDVALLEGNPEGGYRVSARIPLSTLLDREPDGWTTVIMNPTCQIEANGLLISAGETAWEGEGFIAVQEAASGSLVWLLHLCESEAFVDVRFVGDTILAVSAAHPHRYQWQIPLHNPALLQLVA
jgi:hypothetical protein